MSLTLDAPLLPPIASGLEEQLEAQLEALVANARESLGSSLHAVVLGGSLARGRGVLLQAPTGTTLASDIDLYLVTRDPEGEKARRTEERLRSRHESGAFGGVTLDLGLVGSRWFEDLPPTLPAHQLVHGHRILWAAEESFRVRVKSVDPARGDGVDPDDALRLLLNRFAEHLLAVQGLRQASPDPRALYHRWKLYLDAPLGWLAIRGLYRPRREQQRAELESIWDGLGRPRPSWWGMGLDLLDSIRRAMETEVLGLERLQELRPESDWENLDAHLEGMGEVRRGRVPELNWCWPFFRDALRSCLELSHEDPGVGLQRAVEEGPPCAADLVLVLKWLRRRPVLKRLREARRQTKGSRPPVSIWYRHGLGGSAPERVQGACALRFGGLNTWDLALRGLLSPQEMHEGAARRGEELDLWLGRHWSEWVMGGRRS